MMVHCARHDPRNNESKPYVQLASASFAAVCARGAWSSLSRLSNADYSQSLPSGNRGATCHHR